MFCSFSAWTASHRRRAKKTGERYDRKGQRVVDERTFTASELTFRRIILAKDAALRAFLAEHQVDDAACPSAWLAYLTGIKDALGNLNNDVSFAATLLIKDYLQGRFGISDFDAGGKAQGAVGMDIEAITLDGLIIVGELKTTKPYQSGFGAQQRTMILKDLDRLHSTAAD